jgi:hypothetical protein
MFLVSDSMAAAIRRAYDEGGESAATVELKRHFPGMANNADAGRFARAIAGRPDLPPSAAPRLRRTSKPMRR